MSLAATRAIQALHLLPQVILWLLMPLRWPYVLGIWRASQSD